MRLQKRMRAGTINWCFFFKIILLIWLNIIQGGGLRANPLGAMKNSRMRTSQNTVLTGLEGVTLMNE